MRVIFAGTPEFAKVALEGLLAAGFDIPLVLTQPDRPSGRGMKLQASAVKQCAQMHKLQVIQPHGLRLDGKFATEASAAQQVIAQAHADVMVVAAYGLILPLWTLAAPRLGCINIHASLLPRWRGAAPIHRAIQSGDTETGVTLMQMDAGLDTGDMLMIRKLRISLEDTTSALHDKLAELGGQMVVAALPQLGNSGLKPEPQSLQGVTYAHKIEKQEAAVDWSMSAEQIERNIRAFNPFPVTTTRVKDEPIKLWRSEIESTTFISGKDAGEILSTTDSGVLVQCGVGTLWLTELQRAGGKRLASRDFMRGYALPVGTLLQ